MMVEKTASEKTGSRIEQLRYEVGEANRINSKVDAKRKAKRKSAKAARKINRKK